MSRGKLVGLFALLTASLILAILGIRWLHFRLTHTVTNAVFVESDTFTKVAYKRVSGRIEELFKEEGDLVRRGEALAKLEDRDYRVKLEELRRQIGSLEKEREALLTKFRASAEEIKSTLMEMDATVSSLREELRALQTREEQLRKDKRRMEELYRKGVVPLRNFEEVDTELKALGHRKAALEMKIKALIHRKDSVRAKLEEVKSLKKRAQALSEKIGALREKERDLENLLSETVLRSPIDGYVVKRYVSRGEVVRAGQFIYAMYDPEDLYILVLLEETKLKGVEVGNRVLITIDAFPEERFEGVVEEIGRAAAAKFALIPRDVTAGEFTKVAQRIPVKVKIVKGRRDILRVGMGGEVAIEKR